MAHPKNVFPSYKKHPRDHTARVWVDGRWLSLGAYDSPESKAEYERVCNRIRTGKPAAVAPADLAATPSVAEVVLSFWKHALDHYRRADGTPTNEIREYKYLLRPVRELFGQTPAVEFGPAALKQVRHRYLELGWARTTINNRVRRLKHVFAWAAGEEMVPSAVPDALRKVKGLQKGRTAAREPKKVRPADPGHVEITLLFLSPELVDLVRLWLKGPAASSPAYNRTIAQLTHSGGELVFNGRLGNVQVGGGGKRDLAWGPVPEVVNITTDNGMNNLIEWTVRFSLPHCDQAPTFGAIMDLSTECSFDLDQSGYTTRVFTATLRIPMARRSVGDATVPDSADLYLDEVVPAPIPGFRRIPPSRQLSADKCELTVTVKDVELSPNVPPEGMIEASSSHTYTSEGAAPVRWVGTVTASYEIARGSGKTGADAARAFAALCKDRIGFVRQELKRKGLNVVPHPVRYTFGEPTIYGKQTANFSLVYTISGVLSDVMLGASGLWRAVPGSNWRQWMTSIAGSVGDRGNANLVFRPGDDRLVSLCDRVTGTVQTLGTGKARPQQLGLMPEVFGEVTAENSWYSYTNSLFWDVDQGISTLRTLPPKSTSPVVTAPSGGTSTLSTGGGGGGGTSAGGIPVVIPPAGLGPFGIVAQFLGIGEVKELPTGTGRNMANVFGPTGRLDNNRDGEVKVQGRVRPLVYLFMVGSATRVGFPIPEPVLESVNGVSVYPANRLDMNEGFAQEVVGQWGRPVYGAAWRFRYAVPSGYIEGPLPVLPNPMVNAAK